MLLERSVFNEELARMRSGEDDVKGLVYRCKQFFKIDGVSKEMKVELASMHVYDMALVWHQQFIKKYGDNVPWDMYEKKALKRLELSEACAVSLFIGGLKQEISVPIRMFKVTGLVDVYCLAKMQESIMLASKPSGQFHCLEVVLDEEIKVFADDLPNVVDEQLGLSMTVGEITYVIGVMVLPLGACDMVLGIQWLATLGDIQFNFKKLTMLSCVGNQKLEGTTLIEKHEIDIVLDEFKEVFAMPTSFPAKRSHDHHIPLMPNTTIVNVRPYRYLVSQKDTTEQMVKELLEAGVIRSS
nr:transposon Ty3-I Gag-Pol polyprotein [Tanacetum cinerariifolium]